MDQKKTGALIRVLRLEKGLTQQGLAELLGVSNRAVSKWERGLGSPDLSLLPALSLQLGVDLAGLLSGGLPEPDNTGGSMKHIRFFFCPQCGDLITATGEAAVSCCGRRTRPPASRSIRWRTSGSSPPATPWRKGTACPFWPWSPASGPP